MSLTFQVLDEGKLVTVCNIIGELYLKCYANHDNSNTSETQDSRESKEDKWHHRFWMRSFQTLAKVKLVNGLGY